VARRPRPVIEYRVYELSLDFPVLLLDGDRWRISDVRRNHLHFHNCLEIGVCHSDSGILHVREGPLRFCAGNITCIPQHIPHTTYSAPGCSSLWSYIFVDLRELLRELIHTPENFELTSFSADHYEFLFDADAHPKVHFLVSCILEELRAEQPNYRITVRALFIALYYEFLRIFSVRGEQAKQAPDKRKSTLVLAPALNYINANYMNRITVDELADMCHLSTTHFRRLFVSIMGTSPLNFINTTRVDRAATLLQATEDAVLEIAWAVGFSSVSSFNRYFSRIASVSPREYRNRHLQGDMTPKRHRILRYSGWMLPEP